MTNLTLDEKKALIRMALEAREQAYVPYSDFMVGAALRAEDGRIFTGCNVENAAFTPTSCAERTALFAAQAHYPDQPVLALAIAARNAVGLTAQPVTPCGACRQVALEVEDRYQQPMRVLLYGTEGVYVVGSMHDLVPLSFSDGAMR